MRTLKNHKITLSLLSSLVVVAGVNAQAMAQSTTEASESTTQSDFDTDSDTWEDSTDATDITSSGFAPGTGTVSWIPSHGPNYGHVSCPSYRHSHWPHPFPHPGSTGSHGFGRPDAPMGEQLLELGYNCSIDNYSGATRYRCQCGELAQERVGQLGYDWFFQRPSPEAQFAGCEELFKQQCGDVQVKAASDCSSSYGTCETSLVEGTINAEATSTLTLSCECLDRSAWGAGEVYPTALNLNGALLRDRCEAELSLCGVEPVGKGIADTLGLGASVSSQLGCSSAFGGCMMQRGADGEQSIECQCQNGKRTQAKGDLGWIRTETSELLKVCEQELSVCEPNGGAVPALGAEEVGGTAGAPMPGMSTGTGGGQGDEDAQAPVQLNCSLGEGPGRGGWALIGLGMLLGLRRRRQN